MLKYTYILPNKSDSIDQKHIKIAKYMFAFVFVHVQVPDIRKGQKELQNRQTPSTRLKRARNYETIVNFIWSIEAKDENLKD